MLTVASIDRFDTVNAPSNVAVTIWFSGCNIKCHNCHNPKLQDRESGSKYEIGDLFDTVIENLNKSDLKDVVLLGGEPLDQDHNDIASLCELLHISGIRIHLYTGYEFEQIHPRILKYLWWVKTGKYDDNSKINNSILASSNQKMWHIIDGKWRMVK